MPLLDRVANKNRLNALRLWKFKRSFLIPGSNNPIKNVQSAADRRKMV